MTKLFILITAVSSATLAKAQIIKIQCGAAISKLDWHLEGISASFYKQPLLSGSFLAGIDYLDRRYFNLSSNIGLIRKGGKDKILITNENGHPTGENITFKAHLDYLTLNTCIDLKYSIKEKFAPFISIGPRFDYKLSHSKEFDPLKTLNNLNNSTFGFLLGAGLKYELSKLQFGMRADYYQNFSKIAEWPAESQRYGGEISVKTYTLNLSVGYKLK